ncbi:MAG: PilN domain-containing protein, partial [Silvanigrellaceae bacterium]|nr:PilN domain-containing protein [Silvanigrellaceae bacterium]
VSKINKIFTIFVVIFSCLFVTYFIRSSLYNKQIKVFTESFRNDLVSLVGSEPRVLKNVRSKPDWTFTEYSSESAKLIYQIVSEKESLLQRYGEIKAPLSLRLLRNISMTIPKELYFEVTNFRINNQELTIEAETDSLTSSDKILENLKKIKILKSVNRVSQENKAGSEENILRFVIEAKIVEG